jgi:hypothetical protein
MGTDKGGCRPDEEQRLLLRAALLQGNEALNAWEEWKSRVDIDRIDSGSYRILPLLYRNLAGLGVQDPLLGKLKGVYRQAWYRNQMLLHAAAGLLEKFTSAGIETMVLKGAALVSTYYRDPGARPMVDLDVLVPAPKAMDAIHLLSDLGWKSITRPIEFYEESVIAAVNSNHFVGAEGHQVDLHWHLLPECRHPSADEDFWKDSVPLRILHADTSALNRTDQLLHTCFHGIIWNPVPPVRWVADAMMILQAPGPDLDWERLLAQALRLRMILRLKTALRYLAETLQAPLPPGYIDRLEALPVSRLETMEHRFMTRRVELLGGLPELWFYHLRAPGGTKFIRKLIGFPTYLRRYWGLTGSFALPIGLARKIAGRIAASLGKLLRLASGHAGAR